jgi:hypothetical protein
MIHCVCDGCGVKYPWGLLGPKLAPLWWISFDLSKLYCDDCLVINLKAGTERGSQFKSYFPEEYIDYEVGKIMKHLVRRFA